MVSAGLARDWAFLLFLGEAVPRRLTLLCCRILCCAIALQLLSFPRPLQGLRILGLPSCPPIPWHRELCQAPRPPAAGLWWGLKVRLHNAGRRGAGGRGCVRRGEIRLLPSSFLLGGTRLDITEKKEGQTVRSENLNQPRLGRQ